MDRAVPSAHEVTWQGGACRDHAGVQNLEDREDPKIDVGDPGDLGPSVRDP